MIVESLRMRWRRWRARQLWRLVLNSNGRPCKSCGQVHAFATVDVGDGRCDTAAAVNAGDDRLEALVGIVGGPAIRVPRRGVRWAEWPLAPAHRGGPTVHG